jgi:hypothetical protein
VEAPELIGKTMFTATQAASALSMLQATEIVAVVSVEADELRQWFPFVDTEASVRVPELPRCPAKLGSLPIDDSAPENNAGPGRESLTNSPWFIDEADFPEGCDEIGLEVFAVRPAELDPASVGDRRDECDTVIYVPKREARGHESPARIVVAAVGGAIAEQPSVGQC